MKAAWIAAIVLRAFAAASFSPRPALGLFLLLTLPCEALLLGIAFAGLEDAFDYCWRAYSLIQVSAMFLVARSMCPSPPSLRGGLALALTVIFAGLQYRSMVWPEYWLEPVFWVISWCYCFLGLVLAGCSPKKAMPSIVAAWLLLTAVLYSGCAISIDSVGTAAEILNCCEFAAIFLLNMKKGQATA